VSDFLYPEGLEAAADEPYRPVLAGVDEEKEAGGGPMPPPRVLSPGRGRSPGPRSPPAITPADSPEGPQDEEGRLRRVVLRMRRAVPPGERAVRLRTFRGVVTGAEVVRWLVDERACGCRAEAIELATGLAEKGLIVPVVAGYDNDQPEVRRWRGCKHSTRTIVGITCYGASGSMAQLRASQYLKYHPLYFTYHTQDMEGAYFCDSRLWLFRYGDPLARDPFRCVYVCLFCVRGSLHLTSDVTKHLLLPEWLILDSMR
jgi:hypothetical protein